MPVPPSQVRTNHPDLLLSSTASSYPGIRSDRRIPRVFHAGRLLPRRPAQRLPVTGRYSCSHGSAVVRLEAGTRMRVMKY